MADELRDELDQAMSRAVTEVLNAYGAHAGCQARVWDLTDHTFYADRYGDSA
jgi:hypothetical protein